MGSEKLTVAQRHALEWVGEKARRPWGKGRKGYPKMVSLQILVRQGLVEQECWSCGQFSLTLAGRAALSPAGQGGRDAES